MLALISLIPCVSFWLRMLQVSCDTAIRRFRPNYQQYLNAVILEAQDRQTHSIRSSIEDYLSLRRRTGGMKPSFDILLLPFEIPDSVLQDPRIVNLEIISIDLVSVANVS